MQELHQTIELLQKTLIHHELVTDVGIETIRLILSQFVKIECQTIAE